ncbi:MarR family winged helix-turn-helix transcriptional regulator [Candidimonas nitroreducens]|uniref:MarR family transcriptional regulator n=1 Tax=Candidimonas nitroreducens TaxID=683354 RepID=A0A225M4V5_9BURK|nr:MarR family transcriptional regulator [Candidimonas nitroreducens]OWT55722.1 MarR family transcriptional regulator [Candidimonas nitroreducens]
MQTSHGSVGAELLDVVARLNRWVTLHTSWTLTVTLAQARVLSQIDGLGTTRISDLARAENCSAPTMTTQIRRLEELGLVGRRPDPDDARASRISLTDQGRQALAGARKIRADIAESLIDQLDAAQRQRLQDAVQALAGLLDVAYRQTPIQQEL